MEFNQVEQQTTQDFTGWKRRTVLFMAGQTVSLFGSSLVQYAILWHLTLTAQSGLVLTVSTTASFLPQIVISMFAGVWADRYNRKFLIIFADLLTAVSTLILAILFMLGYEQLWLLYVISAIRSVGAGIQTPSVNALLPQIVPPDRLLKVNGLTGTIQPILYIISPLLAGTMMSLFRLETIFFVDVVTAALAVSLLMMLKVPDYPRATHAVSGYMNDLKMGLRYIRNHRVIRVLFTFNAVSLLMVSPAAFLTPLLVARSYGEEVWRLTANEITFFVGMILGGLLMTTWGGFKNRFQTIGLGSIVIGLLFAALGMVDLFGLYLALMFLAGIPMPLINVPSTTLLQEMVEPDIMGRVFGINQLVSTIAMPAGMLIFGPLADLVEIETLLIISGFLLALPGVWIFFNRQLNQTEPYLTPAD